MKIELNDKRPQKICYRISVIYDTDAGFCGKGNSLS